MGSSEPSSAHNEGLPSSLQGHAHGGLSSPQLQRCTLQLTIAGLRSAHHESCPSSFQRQAHGGHSSQNAAGCNGALCSARHASFHQRHSHEGGQQRSYSGHGVVHSQAQSPHLGREHLARMRVKLSPSPYHQNCTEPRPEVPVTTWTISAVAVSLKLCNSVVHLHCLHLVTLPY